MDLRRTPALVPSLALILGVAGAVRLERLSVPGLVALVALALAGRFRWSLGLAALALGALVVQVQGGMAPGAGAALEDRVVTVSGRVVEHWRADELGWRGTLRVERLQRHRRPEPAPARVLLTLPGAEPPPPLGSRLRIKGRLVRSPGFANGGAPPRPGPWRLHPSSRRLVKVVAEGSRLDRISARLRRRAEAALETHPGRAGSAMARALLLGDPSQLPAGWVEGLRECGLAHLLAVSGLHVGLVAGVALLLAGLLPVPVGRGRRALALLFAASLVALYLLLVGPRSSALRAALMGWLGLSAAAGERPASPLNNLAWAAAALVVWQPSLVDDLGFRLTVGATLGIVLLATPLALRWSRLPRWLARPLAVSVAAQLAVLPWAGPVFGQVSPASALLNLIAVPWMAICLIASPLWLAVDAVSPALSVASLGLLDAMAAPFGWPERWSHVVDLSISIPGSSSVAWLLAGLGLAVAWWPRRGIQALLGLAVVVALASTGQALLWTSTLGSPGSRLGAPGPLEVVVLDVGQGDSILVRDGEQALLVDGGGWQRGDFGGRVLLPALRRLGVRRLRAVALTHPDLDHCGGLNDIAGSIAIEEVWIAPGWPMDSCAGGLYTLPGARLRPMWEGEWARLGRWRITVLNPPARPPEPSAGRRRQSGGGQSDNDRSLVLLAQASGRTLLLAGDVGAGVERRLSRRWPPLADRLDLLKVAHHGSKSSTSELLLRRARPRFALISAGLRNRYGHPSALVLQRLRRHRIPVLRTDLNGQIRVRISEEGAMRIDWAGW